MFFRKILPLVVMVTLAGCSDPTIETMRPANLRIMVPKVTIAGVGDTVCIPVTVDVLSTSWEGGDICSGGQLDSLLIFADSSSWIGEPRYIECVSGLDTIHSDITAGSSYALSACFTSRDAGQIRIIFKSTFADECFNLIATPNVTTTRVVEWSNDAIITFVE